MSSSPVPPQALSNRALRLRLWALLGVWTVLVFPFIIIAFNGHQNIESAQSFCPFKLATGMPCPGCGITKSLVFLCLGDVWKSISYHIFGPLVMLGSVGLSVGLIAEIISKKELLRPFLFHKKAGYVLGACLVVYHLVRLFHFLFTHSLTEIIKESAWG